MQNIWLLLLVIIAANGAPIVLHKCLGQRFFYPVDMNWIFIDGKRLLGNAKTWLGVTGILLVSVAMSWIVGLGWTTGLIAGFGVITGDLFSSFIKRRLKMRVSSMALGLDQIPESLFPFWLLKYTYHFSFQDIFLGVICFMILELIISHLLYRWHVREKPY